MRRALAGGGGAGPGKDARDQGAGREHRGFNFHRLQFTPDLLPADLTGTDIYRPQDGTFEFREGPLFHNLILADEINRAPAKVQSALLEAMEERQITVGENSYKLPNLFMVMATQNPIEQEGTYPLPEAQLDRFLMHVQVGYPSVEDERKILILNRDEAKSGKRDAFAPPELMPETAIMEARQQILGCISRRNSRNTSSMSSLPREIRAQSRKNWTARSCMAPVRVPAWVSIDVPRAHAWLQGRDYVGPEDIQEVAADVLRHRLVLSFEAEADGVEPDSIINGVLDGVGVP